jgi:hypothetical protein
MLHELRTYYEKNGISALGFSCKHYPDCSAGCPTFTKAKEAFVSTGYENHTLPRLLFISLDSGSGEKNPKYRTLEYMREQEERFCDVRGLEKFKHWYRTHELARAILRNFKFDLRLDDVHHFFAHTNSAKCCMNKSERAQADRKLFKNCRGFIPGEVAILNPDIIITQGDAAEQSILGCFQESNLEDFIHSEFDFPEVRVIFINGSPVLWIHTYHPRNSGGFKSNMERLGEYSRIARDFINGE